jgi:hypothetical protein
VSEVVEDRLRLVQVILREPHRPKARPPQNPIAAPVPLHRRRGPVSGEAIELDDQTGATSQKVRFIPLNPDAALGLLDTVPLEQSDESILKL